MVRLTCFLTLLVLAKAQNLLGIDYSFDTDYCRNFDSSRCNNESGWRLVNYKSLNIEVPSTNSDTGIQAVGRSCTSSFLISFFHGAIEFNVYLQVISKKFRISFEVFDERHVRISRRYYGQSSKEFTPGWQKIYINVTQYVNGYIKIRGKSLKNETVLIDAFRYIPKNGIRSHYKKKFKRSISYEKYDNADIIFDFEKLSNLNQNIENLSSEEVFDSFDDEASSEFSTQDPTSDSTPDLTLDPIDDFTADPTPEPTPESTPYPTPDATDAYVIDSPDNSFWNVWTIALVSFASLLFVALIAVSAYHIGKLKGMDNSPQVLVDDIDPPRSIIIPRVTGVKENRLSSLRFD